MNIVKAEQECVEECVDIIFKSEIGRRYYPTKETLYKKFERGMVEGDKIYIAKNLDKDIKGLVWYQQEGMFHVFPYLHMIVVRNDCQHQGIGRQLLDFFEYNALMSGYNHLRTKVFLTVGDFNVDVERMYIKRGYFQVGEIKDLYRKRTTEKLYMKIVIASDFQ